MTPAAWEAAHRLPLRPPSTVAAFGPTLVVAPHPDDESLGSGGALALLRDVGLPVHVLFVSDGAGSHPGSRRYPPARLAALREREARSALAILGVPDCRAAFLRLPDRRVPRAGSPSFAAAVARCRAALDGLPEAPRTVILPWRRDPHTDHRASWELVMDALSGRPAARVLEYPIWLWTHGAPDDTPRGGEVAGWRLDIAPGLARKRAAIAAHRSQTTPLIDDDPDAYCLKPEILDRLAGPTELFFEAAISPATPTEGAAR